MNALASYLLASSYSALSPAVNLAAVTCRANGQEVACPQFLTVLGPIIFIIWLLSIVVSVVLIIGVWKVFTKAGKPGWAVLVPIYNFVVFLEIAGRPLWWVLLTFIPFINIIISIVVVFDIARVFGKGLGYALGLIFLPFIFYPMLGFGSAQYLGSSTMTGSVPPPAPPPTSPMPPSSN